MNYTAPEILLFIGGISASLVAVITAWKTNGKVAAAAIKTDETNREVAKVHTLVNDRATKQDEEIKELRGQITILIETIAKKDQINAIAADRISQSQIPVIEEINSDVKIVKSDVGEVKDKIRGT